MYILIPHLIACIRDNYPYYSQLNLTSQYKIPEGNKKARLQDGIKAACHLPTSYHGNKQPRGTVYYIYCEYHLIQYIASVLMAILVG